MRTILAAVFSITLITSLVNGQDEVSDNSDIRVIPYTVVTRAPDGSFVNEQRLSVLLPGETGARPYEGLDIALGMNPTKGDSFDPNRVPFFENKQFLHDIGAVDSQVEQSNQAKQKYISSVTEMVRKTLENGKGSINDKAKTELVKRMNELRAEMESAASKVLLPHQIELLKNRRLLTKMKRGVVAGLEDDEIRKELKLTDAQIDEMKALEKELDLDVKRLRDEMENRISELKKKGKDKMFSILNPEQRNRLKEMLDG